MFQFQYSHVLVKLPLGLIRTESRNSDHCIFHLNNRMFILEIA